MSSRHFLPLIVATTLALSAIPIGAAEHAHAHDAHGAAAPILDNGQKWKTDAPLRQGMASIKAALQPQRHAIHANKLKPAAYQTLAKQTRAQVAFIVDNCKLAPAADAQLHRIIADLGAAADAMAGKDKASSQHQSQHRGALQLVHALETYGELFDHPGWAAPATKQQH